MSRETIKAGQWILAEGAHYGYLMYKLLKGKVSIFRSGAKVNEIEVKEGGKPVFLGIIAALRDDGIHTASVQADSNIEVEQIYLDQIRGIIKNEVPEDIKDDLSVMVHAIVLQNEITSLEQELASLPKIDFSAPDNERIREVLEEIGRLYKSVVS